MSEVVVREAVRADLDGLVKLIFKSTGGKTKITAASLYDDLFKHLGDEIAEVKDIDPCIELDTNLFKSNAPMMNAYVAENSNQLVGYLMFHYYWAPWVGKMALVDDIFILSDLCECDTVTKLLQKVQEHGQKDDLRMVVFSVAEKEPRFFNIISNMDLKVIRDDKKDWSVYRVPMQRT